MGQQVALRQKFGLSYIFIAHDLAVVRHIADCIAVMYLGEIVEKRSITASPRHPYTRALVAPLATALARRTARSAVPNGWC